MTTQATAPEPATRRRRDLWGRLIPTVTLLASVICLLVTFWAGTYLYLLAVPLGVATIILGAVCRSVWGVVSGAVQIALPVIGFVIAVLVEWAEHAL